MKVCLHWQLDLIKLRLLKLFLCCFLFYSSISPLHLVLIWSTTLKPVYHTCIGAIYVLTTRLWVSLRCCRGDVCGGAGASGDGNTAPMECYGAGADALTLLGWSVWMTLLAEPLLERLGRSGAWTTLAGL